MTAKCPTCNTVHPKAAPLPGDSLVCAECDETFTVPAAGAPAARPRSADPEPKREPKPRPAPKPEPKPAAPTGRTTGAPRQSYDEDEDGDDKPKPRRPRGKGPPRLAIIVGGGALFLAIVIGIVAGVLAPMWKAAEDRRAAKLGGKPPAFQPPNAVPPNPAPNPPFVPPVQPEPPQPKPPAVPAFTPPTNPYKAGTQTRLRELRAVPLPTELFGRERDKEVRTTPLAYRLVYAREHDLLLLMKPGGVWVYDLAADKPLDTRLAEREFTDISLAPDGSAVFVADFGGEEMGYGRPLSPSRVHRFDLATRKWEARRAPKIAFRVEAVDSGRVLLEAFDQWVDVTLNRWDDGSGEMKELARVGAGYHGDMEYDPRTGRVYHAPDGLTVRQLNGDALDPVPGGRRLESKGRWSLALSRDGGRVYYGRTQASAAAPEDRTLEFPERIFAASRDVAFGEKGYYRASDATELGKYAFTTATGNPDQDLNFGPPAITVSPDGLSVWIVDRTKGVARHYALEGDE